MSAQSVNPAATPARPPTMLSVLRNRDFLLLETNSFFGTLAAEILIVAVTWMIYDRTRDPFLLGLTGFVQFLPFLCLVLLTGSVADRYSRRRIIVLCMVVEFVARGRVSAVNSVLVNASNELGAFRAGAVARVIGPVEAAVLGGVCTLAVTGLRLLWFPKLRQADDLSGAEGARE